MALDMLKEPIPHAGASDAQSKMDGIELKLRNVLFEPKICSFCFQVSQDLFTLERKFGIIMDKEKHTKPLKDIIDTVLSYPGSITNIMASKYICAMCTEKAIQVYSYIETMKYSVLLMNSFVNDLVMKTDAIESQVNPQEYDDEKPNVFVILESDLSGRENIELTETNLKKELHEESPQKVKHQCSICDKEFTSNAFLTTHYKVHNKVKCQFCNIYIPKDDMTDHMKLNHPNTVFPCNICGVAFYSETELFRHAKETHSTEPITLDTDELLCVCLAKLKKEKAKYHKCFYGCGDCFTVPCVHYKYLRSFREQVLNKAAKIKCVDCDFYYKKKIEILAHANRIHLNHHPYTCDDCGTQFFTKQGIKTHIVETHWEFQVCQFCDKRFRDKVLCAEHVDLCKVNERAHKCKECVASFHTEKALEYHVKFKHADELFQCNKCNRKFISITCLQQHMKTHKSVQRLMIRSRDCPICDERFDCRDAYNKHIEEVHKDNYKCKLCPKSYKSLLCLKSHLRLHKGKLIKVNCPICSKLCSSYMLRAHIKSHSQLKARDGAPRIYSCKICNKSYPNKGTLSVHIRNHGKCDPCPYCGKIITPSNYKKHLLRHTNPELAVPQKRTLYQCDLCTYITAYGHMLEKHMNKEHLKIYPYACGVCDKRFLNRPMMNSHMKMHADQSEKKVKCLMCDMMFHTNTLMKIHLRLHTGEKPYECDLCEEKFSTASRVKAHKLTKHMEKMAPCPLCDKKFHLMSTMRSHVKKVHWRKKDEKFDPRKIKELTKDQYYLFEDSRRTKLNEEDFHFA